MITAGDLAERIGATLEGKADTPLHAVRPPESATTDDLAFVADGRAIPEGCTPGAFLVGPARSTDELPEGIPRLVHENPRVGFALAIGALHPEVLHTETGVHPTAAVDPTAKLAEGVRIGPYVVIGPEVHVGRDTTIEAGSVLTARIEVGEDCRLLPNVTIYPRTVLGDRVRVQSGTVIGSDGFGFVPATAGGVKVPHVGGVRIGNDVEVGANCTVDRGVLDDTVLEDGVKLDNLVHIAHNCRLGRSVMIAAQTGIAGTTTIGEGTIVGGQVGMIGHLKIGARCRIAGQSGVTRDWPDDTELLGFPATDAGTARRAYVLLFQLPELRARIEALIRRVERALPEGDGLLD